MNIINPNNQINFIKIIPRSYDEALAVRILLRNEDTNAIIDTNSISSNVIGNELDLAINHEPFIEGQRFQLTVEQDGKTIFKGKVLVTSLNSDNYTINNNEFQIDTDTDSNELKVYE